MVRLRPAVREALLGHGVAPSPADSPETLRGRLNDVYLDEVRRLRGRQRAGEIPLGEYAGAVEALRGRFPLLGLPLDRWTE